MPWRPHVGPSGGEMTPEAFSGEWGGREVRVVGSGVAEPERARGKDAPGKKPEWVAHRRPKEHQCRGPPNPGGAHQT